MRAARFVGPNQPIELTDVTEPRPGPNDVVVRVEACGICASDLHFIEGEMPLPVPPPLTMGHEASGTVSAVGAEVPVWREGDSVSLVAGKGCHRCHRCAAGLMEECRNPQLLGIHFDGGWAEQVVVPWYLLAAVPEGVSFEHAAIACDAVATPFAALSERGGLQAGERAMGLGADLALDPDEDVPEEIRRATGGRGLDMAVDLVGRSAVIKQAIHALGRGGRVVVVGQSLEPVEAGPLLVLSFLGLGVLGHLGYQKRHLERVLDLIASGRLDLSASISARVPLDDVNEGVARLSAKTDAPVRVVVLPGGSHPG